MKRYKKNIVWVLILITLSSIFYVIYLDKKIESNEFLLCRIYKEQPKKNWAAEERKRLNAEECDCEEGCDCEEECGCEKECNSEENVNLEKNEIEDYRFKYKLIDEVKITNKLSIYEIKTFDYKEHNYDDYPWIGGFLYYIFFDKNDKIIKTIYASKFDINRLYIKLVIIEKIDNYNLIYLTEGKFGWKNKKLYDYLMNLKQAEDVKSDERRFYEKYIF